LRWWKVGLEDEKASKRGWCIKPQPESSVGCRRWCLDAVQYWPR
jgi:hypothetical protein